MGKFNAAAKILLIDDSRTQIQVHAPRSSLSRQSGVLDRTELYISALPLFSILINDNLKTIRVSSILHYPQFQKFLLPIDFPSLKRVRWEEMRYTEIYRYVHVLDPKGSSHEKRCLEMLMLKSCWHPRW